MGRGVYVKVASTNRHSEAGRFVRRRESSVATPVLRLEASSLLEHQFLPILAYSISNQQPLPLSLSLLPFMRSCECPAISTNHSAECVSRRLSPPLPLSLPSTGVAQSVTGVVRTESQRRISVLQWSSTIPAAEGLWCFGFRGVERQIVGAWPEAVAMQALCFRPWLPRAHAWPVDQSRRERAGTSWIPPRCRDIVLDFRQRRARRKSPPFHKYFLPAANTRLRNTGLVTTWFAV